MYPSSSLLQVLLRATIDREKVCHWLHKTFMYYLNMYPSILILGCIYLIQWCNWDLTAKYYKPLVLLLSFEVVHDLFTAHGRSRRSTTGNGGNVAQRGSLGTKRNRQGPLNPFYLDKLKKKRRTIPAITDQYYQTFCNN